MAISEAHSDRYDPWYVKVLWALPERPGRHPDRAIWATPPHCGAIAFHFSPAKQQPDDAKPRRRYRGAAALKRVEMGEPPGT